MEKDRSRHADWENNIYQWVLVRDAISGESAIKQQSELYLPIPAAMENAAAPSHQRRGNSNNRRANDIHNQLTNQLNPNYHHIAAYEAYKTRAQFPEICSGVLRGMLGMAQQSMPSFELPRGMEYLEYATSKSGAGLIDFYYQMLAETLSVGRVGLCVDIDDEDGMPKIVSYSAESMVDWDAKSHAHDERRLNWIMVSEVDPDTGDMIERHLRMEDGMFVIDTYKDGICIEEGEPATFRGKAFDRVPMVIAGSSDIAVDVDIAPMSAIARTAVQIYQMDADLRQGEYMSCNPFLVFSGISDEFVPQAVGATTAVVLPPADARAYYPSTDTSALAHVSSRIDEQYQRALAQGITLVGGNVAESGEALKIRQQANTATLAAAAEATAKGIELCLKYIADIMQIDREGVSIEAGKEFGFTGMTAQDQQVMVQNWMAGAISRSTMLENFRRGGLLHDGETADDEIERVENEAPMAMSSVGVVDDTEPAPEVQESN